MRELEQVLLQATSAAESEASGRENSFALQKRLAEQDDVLSKLDRAKLQEEVNKAMEVLSDTFGDIVPTVAEVQRKIETRLARAQGMAAISTTQIDGHMLEVEAAQRSAEAEAPALGAADPARTRRARDEGAHGVSADQDFWQPPVSARDNGYISAAPLARVLRWMFGGWVMLTVFGASSSFFAYRTLSSYLDGDPSIDVNQVDTMHAIASGFVVLELIALLTTGVVFITWTRRLYRNVAPLGGETRFKPGWAVGGWFVPLLNLVRPKQVLDDAWREGMVDSRDLDQVDKPPPFMEFWWALFVIAPFAASFLTRSDEDSGA